MRAIALALCFLAMAVAGARAESGLNPTQSKQVEQIIHDYLMKHPDLLLEVMQAADDKEKAEKAANADAAIKNHHAEIFDDPSSQVGGNPHGDVTIVEFFDYRCPYCKQVQPDIDALLKQDPKIRIIYKEFPILGPDSVLASHVAIAAIRQGKYAAFHQTMMATKGTINEDVILKVAGSVGLDVAKIKADMNAPEAEALIKRNYALADALDINGTPAFIIGGKLVPGAIDLDNMKKLVADARQHAG